MSVQRRGHAHAGLKCFATSLLNQCDSFCPLIRGVTCRMTNVYPLCVSAASIQVQIIPHYGEISVGASKFFICEGETAPRRCPHTVIGRGHVTCSSGRRPCYCYCRFTFPFKKGPSSLRLLAKWLCQRLWKCLIVTVKLNRLFQFSRSIKHN